MFGGRPVDMIKALKARFGLSAEAARKVLSARDVDWRFPRALGPRTSADGLHGRVWDFWAVKGPAVCVCLDCWRAWPEGGGDAYPVECAILN